MKMVPLVLALTLIAATPAYAVTPSCSSSGTGSCVNSSGNMEFDISGSPALQIAPPDATCDSNTEGSIRYNASSKTFEGCNGMSWSSFGGGSLTTWAGGYAAGTVYQATTDGFLRTMHYCANNGTIVYSDTSSNPTTNVGQCSQSYPGVCLIIVPIKKGNYWRVDQANMSISWMPLN